MDAKLSEKNVTYKDLTQFSSFEDARESLIEREVDRVLREGIAKQVEWLNGVGFKIPLKHPFVLRAIELGERRNCIVHADCKVNRFYLQTCRERGVDVANMKEGQSLKPDQKYCDSAFETTLVFGCMIFSSAWINICKKEDEKWEKLIEILNEIVYDLMLDDKWLTGKALLEFIFDDLKIEPADIYRRMLKINYALCLRELNDKRKCEIILGSEDWRGSDHSFQAAVSALKGETDEAISFLRTGFAAEQLDQRALIEWPVFNRIRSLKKFKKLYSELLGAEEAERVPMEPVEKHFMGPGMKKVVQTALAQLKKIDAKVDDVAVKPKGEAAPVA